MTAAEMGRKGGGRRTDAQKEAARENLKRANEERVNQARQRHDTAEANLAAIRERKRS